MDGPVFAAWVREVLIPEIEPGTVVILDNLATHHNKHAAEALRAHRCWFLCLPPYSPDLNPIEIKSNALSNAWRSRSHIRKTQGAPAQDRGKNIYRHLQGHRRSL